MQRLVISSSTETLLSAAQDWLAALKPAEALILSESRGAAHDFALRCSRGGGGCLGLHCKTLGQLAFEMAAPRLAESGRSLVTAVGVEALAARSTHLCATQGSLHYFQPVADTPGFARALASTLTELRLEKIQGSSLAASGVPGGDLSRLLDRYREELTAAGLADFAALLSAAAAAALDDASRFRGLPILLLASAPKTRLESAFLQALASRSGEVLGAALKGDVQGISALESLLGRPAADLDQALDAQTDGRLERLRIHLFSDDAPRTEADSTDESLQFFSEPGEARECAEIARKIRFAAEEGIRFDQMAVLLRSPTTYLPLVEEALERAAVPAYFSRGTVRPHPAGRAFLALLECASEGLSATRFSEYLSLGQVPAPDSEGRPPRPEVPWVTPQDEQLIFKTPIEGPAAEAVEQENWTELETAPVVAGSLRTPARWERLIVDASVIGGRDRWERRLAGLEREFEIQLRNLEEEDESSRRRLQDQIHRLRDLRRFALPLIEMLDRLPDQARWSRWLGALEDLAVSALRKPESVLALLAELRAMGAVGPVGLDEVKQALTDRLSTLRTEPPPSRFGCVLVATIPEAAGRAFDLVFLPGLAEGIFPRKAIEDPLLLDAYRQGLEMRAAMDKRRLEERLLLRTAAAAARRRLIVSYPRMDVAQGRSRVPSFYALDVLRAANGRLPDVRKLEKQAAQASNSRLGWPAPSDCRQAIDEAEYDLALLDPLIGGNDENLKGRARFLLTVNPRLERSLRARWWRWSRKFTDADGIVDPSAETLDVLRTRRLRVCSYSPTALQQYSVCPYKFLLYAIHRLRPREEAVAIEQIDPLTRGALFHEVQFELFKQLRERDLLPVSPANSEEVQRVADLTLQQVAGQYEEKLAPAIPRIWASEIDEIASDLRGWIRETEQAGGDWVPLHFELAFGLPLGPERDATSSAEEAVILDGIRVRGSIDLVERSGRRGTLRVVDHKTGKSTPETALVVKGGEILQPILYGLAAEKLLRQPVESGRLFFCTQRGDYRQIDVPLNGESKHALESVLEIVDEAVNEGFLPAAPRSKACDFCDYRVVCGPYEERRIQRKDQEKLKRLAQLREMR